MSLNDTGPYLIGMDGKKYRAKDVPCLHPNIGGATAIITPEKGKQASIESDIQCPLCLHRERYIMPLPSRTHCTKCGELLMIVRPAENSHES